MSRTTVLRVVIGILVGTAILVAGACMNRAPAGIWNDDAAYVSQARQFIATGDLLDVLGHPRGLKFTYLPGYSIFLAPFIVAFPDNTDVLRWVSVGCMLGAASLFGLATRRQVGDLAAIVLGACVFFTPCTLIYGTSLLSEPLFTLLLGGLWLLQQRLEEKPSRPGFVALGLGLACLTITRLPGLLVFVAVEALMLYRRQWQPAVAVAAGMVVGSLPFIATYRSYLGHASETGMRLAAWFNTAPSRIGEDLVGLSIGSWWAGMLILVLATVGLLLEARRRGPTLVTVLLPLYVLQYLCWPYFDARFFLPIWPMLLLSAWQAVPRVPAPVFLSVVLACGTVGVVRTMHESQSFAPDRFATYDWIRTHTQPNDLIEDLDGWRTRMLANRPWSEPGRHLYSMSQFLAEACHDHAAYVLVEPESTIEPMIDGSPVMDVPHRLDAWLDCSTLVEKVYSSRWDRLYRIKVDPDRFVDAFQHFYRGEWNECLREVPDFPEARTSLAIGYVGSHQPADALPLLEQVVHQYPVDVVSAVNLARVYTMLGRSRDAEKTLDNARQAAQTLGLPYQVPR